MKGLEQAARVLWISLLAEFWRLGGSPIEYLITHVRSRPCLSNIRYLCIQVTALFRNTVGGGFITAERFRLEFGTMMAVSK